MMASCRQISERVSASFERDLPLPERFGLRLHLLVCSACRGFANQLHVLRAAARRLGDDETSAAGDLPEAARDRIAVRLRASAAPPSGDG